MAPAERKNRRRSRAILASFIVLFGGGVLVYGVAWGEPRAGQSSSVSVSTGSSTGTDAP